MDVCGTLYDANTTAGFVRFHAARARHRPFLFRLLETLRLRPFRPAVIALGKLLGRDLFRLGYIFCLRGQSLKTLTDNAREYAVFLERTATIQQSHQKLRSLKQEGWKVLLASNSLDIVVAAIAAQNGAPFVASRLAFKRGICTGRLEHDLKGCKWQAVAPHVRGAFAVLTDNRSDADLISRADPAILVAKNSPEHWMNKYPDAEIICHTA